MLVQISCIIFCSCRNSVSIFDDMCV